MPSLPGFRVVRLLATCVCPPVHGLALPMCAHAFGCRFGGWLRQAALQRAPEGAPWRAWKPEAQAAAVEDLLSPLCSQDARRFKRLLKVFCGGKKKGLLGEPPARGK